MSDLKKEVRLSMEAFEKNANVRELPPARINAKDVTAFFDTGGFTVVSKRGGKYNVAATYRSKKTVTYNGYGNAQNINLAVEDAIFDLLVNRANYLNKSAQRTGVRPTDELTGQGNIG